jgi:hypothetical protein
MRRNGRGEGNSQSEVPLVQVGLKMEFSIGWGSMEK